MFELNIKRGVRTETEQRTTSNDKIAKVQQVTECHFHLQSAFSDGEINAIIKAACGVT